MTHKKNTKRISLIVTGVVASLLLFTVCRSQQAQEETGRYTPTTPAAYDPSAGVGDHFSKFRPLHEVYKDYFLFGTTSWTPRMSGERLDIIHHHFNAFTPENAMKPDHVRDRDGERHVVGDDGVRRGGWSFREADEALGLVEGLTIIGHTLAWHQQSPIWLWDHPDFNPDIALQNMRYHIEGVMNKYGHKLRDMDVVNEAIAGNASTPSDWRARLRPEGWRLALGNDWVEKAFQITAEIVDANGWDVKLYYNDYNLNDAAKATTVYNMVKEINERNAGSRPNGKQLIEGIGMQGHYTNTTIASTVERSIELFSTLPGVMISVTELDITWPTAGELTLAQERRQARLYAQLFDIYRRYAAGPANPDPSKRKIERVTVWGTNDADSWRRQAFPLLFDGNLNAKYAFMAVYDPARFAAMIADEEDFIELQSAVAMYATPQLGANDPIWSITPSISVSGQPSEQGRAASAQAQVRLLWSDTHLYVRADVTDPTLDRTSPNPWEQDSVEIFMSESVHRQAEYRNGDGQYRVAYHGEATFRESAMGNGFSSHAEVTENGYIVEMRIPFRVIRPERGSEISLDVQINDVSAGPATRLLTIWSDVTANGFNTTANWGDIRLERSVSGIHIPALAGGEGANIILGNDATVWPYASTTPDGQVAFTPERNGRYRLSFNATSVGVGGYRVRWIRQNDNGSYTVADVGVVTTPAYTFQIGQTADRLPASWGGVSPGSTHTFVMEFVMDGNAQRDGFIGNIGIRGLFGSRAFTLNWIRIERLTAAGGSELITEWPVFDAVGGHF